MKELFIIVDRVGGNVYSTIYRSHKKALAACHRLGEDYMSVHGKAGDSLRHTLDGVCFFCQKEFKVTLRLQIVKIFLEKKKKKPRLVNTL